MSWMWRHRLLSLLGFGLVGAGVAWLRLRTWRAESPIPPQAAPSPQDEAGVVPGPYPGSAKPLPDGATPSPTYTVKGKEGSMLCHGPSSPYYKRTKADVWFRSEHDAVAAGFRASARSR